VAGYTASARLQGATPQFAFAGGHAHDPAALGATEGQVAWERGGIDQLELVGRPIDDTIGEWLASVGESWSQLTFFLFDPESWR